MKSVGPSLEPFDVQIEKLEPGKGGLYGGHLKRLKERNWEKALDDYLEFFDHCYVTDGDDGTLRLTEGLESNSHTGELMPNQRAPRDGERLENHKYFWKGVGSQGSVTGWVETLYKGFDKEGKSREIAARASTWQNPFDKYYMRKRIDKFPPHLQGPLRTAQTVPSTELIDAAQEIIKAEWTAAGDVACAKGSGVHMSMEMFYNDMYDADAPRFQCKEFQQGLQWHISVVQALGWTPWRTEMCFYSEQYGALCGMADMLYKTPDGEIVLVDWKTNKAVTEKAFKEGDTFYPPLEHLPVCKLSKFTVQLNVYALMLEHALGAAYRPVRMIVVWLCDKNPSFIYWDVKDLREALHPMLLERGVMLNFLRKGKKKRAVEQANDPKKKKAKTQLGIAGFFGQKKNK